MSAIRKTIPDAVAAGACSMNGRMKATHEKHDRMIFITTMVNTYDECVLSMPGIWPFFRRIVDLFHFLTVCISVSQNLNAKM